MDGWQDEPRRRLRFDRRALLGAGAASFLVSRSVAALAAVAGDVLRPEDFGARGDGVANDTGAFAALAAEVNRRGGGTIVLRRTTYVVGGQQPGTDGLWAFAPAPVLSLHGLTRALTIEGNGATLRCAPGLLYGTFDRDRRPVRRPLPNYKPGEIASPYEAMIKIVGCRGEISIRDLELDGNMAALRLGGAYGDTGYQIPARGLDLTDNEAAETVANVRSHHHALDGISINGREDRSGRGRFEDVISEYNGRQGVSIVGGRGYDFVRCKFNHTGRSVIQSAPGAGVDIEAENGKRNRDFTFTDCEFSDNYGVGMLADSGDTERATFTRCRFIGTTGWSAWPKKPLFRFFACRFVGSVVNCHGDPNPERAAQFHDCTFTDDPKLAPGGKVYREGRPDGALVDLSDSANVLFSRCRFEAVGGAVLPWSSGAIYSNCVMHQTSRTTGHPRGTYLGRNAISSAGDVNLYGARVRGELTVNGKAVHP